METKTKTKTEGRAKPRPMKVTGKKYASVSEMVRDTSDPEFADEFDAYQAERRMVNCLTVVRCTNGMSQTELAGRMGCGQSKVSKMESSVDADLNFGDMIAYALALKQTVHIAFSPERRSGADHIRFHIACIKQELDRLVKVAGDDKAIGDGVEAFAIEQVLSMLAMVETSLDRLPHRVDQGGAALSVEVEGDRGRRLSTDGPKRARRTSKKAVATS